jgi:hypothetical protein
MVKSKIKEMIMNDNKDSFLDDMNNVNYKTDIVIERPIDKQPENIDKPKSRGVARSIMNNVINESSKPKKKEKEITIDKEEDDNLFSDKPTQILGRDKRELIAKIQQYKSLFPKALSKFKIKKNPSIEELQEYLDEMDVIVSTDNVEQFLTDSILQCIKLIEGVSSYTKYDISGLCEMLKANKQFDTLMKQLYIKYKVFSNVPVEYSAVILISTTAYLCMMKNKKKKELEEYLNQPFEQPQLIQQPEPIISNPEPIITPPEPIITPPEPIITPPEPIITHQEPLIEPIEDVLEVKQEDNLSLTVNIEPTKKKKSIKNKMYN